jgi:hypothetical protein
LTGNVFRLSRRPHRKRGHHPTVCSTVTVFDCDLIYKHCGGSVVLFKTGSAFELIQKAVPVMVDMTDPKSASKLFLAKRYNNNSPGVDLAQQNTWKRAFVSWKALRVMITENVFHQECVFQSCCFN